MRTRSRSFIHSSFFILHSTLKAQNLLFINVMQPVIMRKGYGTGTFKLSRAMIEEYNKVNAGTRLKYPKDRSNEELRMNTTMARIVEENSSEFGKLEVVYIEPKYKDYVEITICNGLEDVDININLYLLDQIAKLLERNCQDEINDEECLLHINELVEQRERMN